MKAAPEVAAITADMAEVSPKPLALTDICAEAAAVIAPPHPLSGPLRALEGAAGIAIPEAAAALRAEAALLAPCPAL